MSWTTDNFDWTSDDESIVLREQRSLAVYPNSRGGIVIREERAWDDDSDCYIVIRPEHAHTVAARILALAEAELEAEAAPATSSNALRQQRYRQRKRNGGVTPPVTGRVAAAVMGGVTDGGGTVDGICAPLEPLEDLLL